MLDAPSFEAMSTATDPPPGVGQRLEGAATRWTVQWPSLKDKKAIETVNAATAHQYQKASWPVERL